MLNGAEIEISLSGLEAYFSGEDKHVDSGLAIADAIALEEQFRPAAEGVPRRDKGSAEVFRHPRAADALGLVATIRQAIDTMEPAMGLAACAELRKLAKDQRWI